MDYQLPDDDGQPETGLRYGAWVRRKMQQRGWNQRELAERAGLAKQTVSRIVGGGMHQPTATQIAGLARAFSMEPDDVLSAIGLWEPLPDNDDDDGPSLDVYLRTSQGLSPEDVQQVIRVIQALKAEDELERLKRELRQRQTVADDAQAVTEEEQEDIAAYDRPDLAAEMRRQALGWTEEDGTDAEPD